MGNKELFDKIYNTIDSLIETEIVEYSHDCDGNNPSYTTSDESKIKVTDEILKFFNKNPVLIKIKIGEFIKGGGILEYGREIYGFSDDNIFYYSKYSEKDKRHYISILGDSGSFSVKEIDLFNIYYVEIEQYTISIYK